MEKITKRQEQLLEIIYNYIKDTGYPPTFEEMRESLNVVSNQSIIDLLTKLEGQKFLKRTESQARSLVLTESGCRVIGKNRLFPVAGFSAAGPFIESFLDSDFKWLEISECMVPNEKIRKTEDVFIIQVNGDSMINAGINNGDMLLVRKSKEFKSGDIVVARNEDGTTVKRFIADGGKRYLKPENIVYKNIPIIPGEIHFDGKVILNISKI